MLSHSRCLCRTLGRSLSALSQGNNVLAGRTASGLSAGNRIVYRNSQLCEFPSSIVVFHVRYFKTSAARRDDVVTVNTPPFSESITEGDVRWEKAVGDSVKEDEVVCEIETDKTSLQVPSPAAGVITELLVPDGGRVEAGNPLFKLKKGAATAKAAAAPTPTPTPASIPVAMPPVPTMPAQAAQAKPVSAVKPTAAAPAAAPEAHGTRKESRVKMNRMRLRIAQRLKEAQETCAMLTTFNEIDMSNIQEMRTLHKDAFLKRHNIKLGFMSAFVKASAHALMDQPSVNGVIDDTTKEIVYRDYVDISVAVATPKGLVVPVIRNVETMNFADIEKTINGLGEKVRKLCLNGMNELVTLVTIPGCEDTGWGTFTIIGSVRFHVPAHHQPTPVCHPGIASSHLGHRRKVEIRPMMYVALTYDHRLIDGREAVTFLRKIKSVVEDPRVLLLDM
ncbi:dihydrolipoyllysine-residue succinyltransferase component of 2-oxoglutarate dehydrogenase complex, mitochondrial [Coregonus clupeaformis]|uniref:dihydrolipoyllysine-residue succinyltransferase component of 2-oxoglutarate dehydrogenase complex, mitochondrial n=1 Tax=Coregonus clupeaformis TaxID=59861 RepID=UPI001E1C4531|nr:dihydrolipoyllysine-residue succinyltransferase component of 2-oxoglutarate dehydrogenase complex, mitochondrial [Coregonus clupeaformis]